MTNFLNNHHRTKTLQAVMLVMLLCAGKTAYAENWYSIEEDPRGKTTQPPKQLEKYPLGENTEKHFPPNQEFTLWTQDETFFKPKEDDKVEINSMVESYISSDFSREFESVKKVEYDMKNLKLLKHLRGETRKNLCEEQVFFISTDQRLRKWDYENSKSLPLILLPSQWMSLILKYTGRATRKDYENFVSFRTQLRVA